MKILIVEDDPTSRKILSSITKKWGFEPLVLENGRQALEALQQPDSPKLVLLDWNLPEIDGIEVCRLLRQDDLQNPPYVILLTGRGEKGDIVRGLEAGANDYIHKPYDAEELHARISVGHRMVDLQTKLVETSYALEFQALHDPLTGTLNRRAILGVLAKELGRMKRLNNVLSVGMCDLDNFKHVNDTYGHQVGDDVLVGFVKRIQSNIRVYDYLGRYGGEEFLVLAPGSEGTSDESLYERLRGAIGSVPICTRMGEVEITVSIGVATVDADDTMDNLLARADAALYAAKELGRNRVVYDCSTGGHLNPQAPNNLE